MSRQRSSALVLLCCGAALLVGCTAEPAPEETPSGATSTPTIPAPQQSDIDAYIAVSCADIIPADLASTLHTAGWSAKDTTEWTVGDVTFADGGLCEWSGGDGDPVFFGWARADAEEATAVQEHLESEGWSAQAEGEVTVLADSDSTATYLFGPNAEVRFGSTREGAEAVTPPPAS